MKSEGIVDSTARHRNRQNRVTPFGRPEASPSRGAFLGNRGDLHGPDGTIRKNHAVKFWICCTLEETNGRKVTFDAPGCYTPLFFWDEAVAMAAGHRPCAQCRRTAFRGFKQALNRSKGLPEDHFIPVKEIDAEMHASRLDNRLKQRVYESRVGDLPSGVFFVSGGDPDTALLLWNGKGYAWSHSGYSSPVDVDPAERVSVLTPRILVETIRAGYIPSVRLPNSTALEHTTR